MLKISLIEIRENYLYIYDRNRCWEDVLFSVMCLAALFLVASAQNWKLQDVFFCPRKRVALCFLDVFMLLKLWALVAGLGPPGFKNLLFSY